MLTVASLLWDANHHSNSFSRIYDETWALKLLNGFARNLTVEFRFVLFTDRDRDLPPCIEQRRIKAATPDYSTCIEPYALGEPMILVGLDTLIIGNIDHLAASCMTRKDLGLPRDPYAKHQACNGVALVPAGMGRIATEHRGQNDMEWVRKFPHSYLDDEFPGQIQSYKGSLKKSGVGDTRICYFHGAEKPPELQHIPWIAENWR